MKQYTSLDQHVPMNFYRFYIYFRMPVSIIRYLTGFVENGFLDIFSFSLSSLEILLYVCACIGLWRMKRWGYVLNKTFLFFEMALFSIMIPIHMYIQNYAAIGSCVAQVVINIPILIYFEKRKSLFCAPLPKTETKSGAQAANAVPAEDKTELLMNHTCTSCGRSFKVRYKTDNRQEGMPALSVVCPFCNAKEILR